MLTIFWRQQSWERSGSTAWLGEVAELSKAIPSPDSSINRWLDKLQTQVEKQGRIIVWQQLYLQAIDWKEREESGNNWSARWRRSFGGCRNGGTPGKLSSHTGGWGTRSDTNRRRAILITFDSKEMKDRALTTSSKLKQATGDFIEITCRIVCRLISNDNITIQNAPANFHANSNASVKSYLRRV